MRTLLLLVALCFSSSAFADVANGRPTFNWTQPATWTNGTALTAAQITGYQLNCGTGLNTRIAATSGVPPVTVPPAPSAPLAAGAYSCTLAVYAKETPTATEVLGIATSPVTFTVPQSRPVAPAALSVD